MRIKRVFAATVMGLVVMMTGGSKVASSAVWYNILTPPSTIPVGHLHLDESSCGGVLAGCSILFGSGVIDSPDFSFAFDASGVTLDSSDLEAAFATFGASGTEFHVNGTLSEERSIFSLPDAGMITIAGIDVIYEVTDVVPTGVPLPAALPMFGSALALIGLIGWRKKRRQL